MVVLNIQRNLGDNAGNLCDCIFVLLIQVLAEPEPEKQCVT